jgi:RluA family pseudouridine synthase
MYLLFNQAVSTQQSRKPYRFCRTSGQWLPSMAPGGYTVSTMNDELPVVYMDDTILVINKPSGYLAMPDRFDPDSPVVIRELETSHGRLWPVAPPDLDSSGLLLMARTDDANRRLSLGFEAGELARTYHVVVQGRPAWTETSCALPLMVDGDRKHRTIIDGSGKSACTSFKVLGSFGRLSLLEAIPRTGRTHQIRVHLAALGYPVLCDALYGDGKPLFLSTIKRRWKGDARTERPLMQRVAVHAWSVDLSHPADGQPIRFEAQYPKDFRALISQLVKLQAKK